MKGNPTSNGELEHIVRASTDYFLPIAREKGVGDMDVKSVFKTGLQAKTITVTAGWSSIGNVRLAVCLLSLTPHQDEQFLNYFPLVNNLVSTGEKN